MMGGTKQDYNLHFLFPEEKVPAGFTGDFCLYEQQSSGRTIFGSDSVCLNCRLRRLIPIQWAA
jgi:hypothetical protein